MLVYTNGTDGKLLSTVPVASGIVCVCQVGSVWKTVLEIVASFFFREIEVEDRSRERDGGVVGILRRRGEQKVKAPSLNTSRNPLCLPFFSCFSPPHQHQAALHSAHSLSTSFLLLLHPPRLMPTDGTH